MSGLAIELILSRQLADCLAVPVFIVDPEGNLMFYNAGAEEILGRKFEDTGPMAVGEWGTTWTPHDEDGNRIPSEGLPLVQTVKTHLPAHRTFWIKSLKGNSVRISVSSIPIVGRSKQFSGAMAIFWDNEVFL